MTSDSAGGHRPASPTPASRRWSTRSARGRRTSASPSSRGPRGAGSHVRGRPRRLEALTLNIVGALLDEPTARLQSVTDQHDADLESARYLFGLEA